MLDAAELEVPSLEAAGCLSGSDTFRVLDGAEPAASFYSFVLSECRGMLFAACLPLRSVLY